MKAKILKANNTSKRPFIQSWIDITDTSQKSKKMQMLKKRIPQPQRFGALLQLCLVHFCQTFFWHTFSNIFGTLLQTFWCTFANIFGALMKNSFLAHFFKHFGALFQTFLAHFCLTFLAHFCKHFGTLL
jgi:hypothetical protein